MESCTAVEKELDRVITKFTGIREHTDKVITDVITLFSEIKQTLDEGKINKD